jgi:ubiquinone/menaquinone biosynthesis C-methylase UbiE
MPQQTYPYFSYLLAQFEKHNAGMEKSFGRHVHWGYWPDASSASGGDEDYALAAENLTRKICAIADIRDHQSILDVGCGFGGTIAYLNERHHGMELTGVTNDRRQLARAEKLTRVAPGNAIAFIAADACALPFDNARFDRVLAMECIFHFPNRAMFLDQAWRVLKPGGSLTISDFVPTALFSPGARLLSAPALQKYSFFGACDITCTLNRYRGLAGARGFEMQASDITAHTLPTYAYLKSILRSLSSRRQAALANATISIMQFISRTGLLKYRIIHFNKP